MINPKLGKVLKFLFFTWIILVCGVMGFSANNEPSPVLKTIELMIIVGVFGYLIYRIDPKPEVRKTFFATKDLPLILLVYVGALLAAHVLSDKWQTINVLKFMILLIGFVLAARMAGKVQKLWLQKVLISILFCAFWAGYDSIFRQKINWDTIFIATSMSLIPQQTNQKESESQETSAIEEDPRVAKGIAKF